MFRAVIEKHLLIRTSDHLPLLFKQGPVVRQRNRRGRFHFENLWMRHEDRGTVISSARSSTTRNGFQGNADGLVSCCEKLTVWNRQIYGQLGNSIWNKE